MCYGFSDHQAHAAARTEGAGRRALLRGAVGGAVGVGAAAALGGTAQAHSRGRGRSLVPRELISLQLYSMRDDLNGEAGFDATLRAVARTGYPRVEQALGYFGRTATELRDFYRRLGLKATSSHDGISPDDAALATKIRNARVLGQSYMVVPWLDSEKLDDWKRYAEQMNHEAEAARRAGIRYGYHNHAHEFTRDLGGGVTPWDVLTGELDRRLVHLEIDIYWVVTGGINSGDGVRDPERFAIDVIRSAPQRVRQYHVKDRDPVTGDMADLGTGMIDFPRIFRAHAVEEYIVENDTPDVTPLQTARVGYSYLRNVRC
ncbi:sugar phosphate isomerase/epimerase family protein [Streptomyces sp. NPDC049879]|uniref:sugar phosphate isomerase/epimerase family protein n=1 Tax=Streptomyces sp. NPDC049879 TaxID=3365598 RepID=UPI0037A8B6F0